MVNHARGGFCELYVKKQVLEKYQSLSGSPYASISERNVNLRSSAITQKSFVLCSQKSMKKFLSPVNR